MRVTWVDVNCNQEPWYFAIGFNGNPKLVRESLGIVMTAWLKEEVVIIGLGMEFQLWSSLPKSWIVA